MKTVLTVLAFSLLCGFQEPAGPPDFQAQVKALRAEYQKAEQEFYKQSRAAKTAEDRQKLVNPAAEYLAKYQALAELAKGTEGGAAALIEAFQLAHKVPKKSADARKALDTLVTAHIDSPLMERLASLLRNAAHFIGNDASRTALETIRDKATVARAKAAALFNLALVSMDKDEAAARAAFDRLKKEFGNTNYASQAEAYIFELDNLQVGKVAPDFEATDEKGVKFKLSDFRGKVTVIDFWGFW